MTTYFTEKQVSNGKMSPVPIINTILRQLNFNIDNYHWIQTYNIFKKVWQSIATINNNKLTFVRDLGFIYEIQTEIEKEKKRKKEKSKKKGKDNVKKKVRGKGKKKNEAIAYDFVFRKPHTGQKHWTAKMKFRFTTRSAWAEIKNKNGTFPIDSTDLQFLPSYQPEPNDNYDIDVGIQNGDLSSFDEISDDQDCDMENEKNTNATNPYIINNESNNLSTEQKVDVNINMNQNASQSVNVNNRQVTMNSNQYKHIPRIIVTDNIPNLPPIETYIRSNTNDTNSNDNGYTQMNIKTLIIKYPWLKSKTLKIKTVEDFTKFLISINIANTLQKNMNRNKLSIICLFGSPASLRNYNRLAIAMIEYNQTQTNNGQKIFLSESQQKQLTEIYSQYFPDPQGKPVTISDVIRGIKNDSTKTFNWPHTFDTSISLSLDTIASNTNTITHKYITETKPKIKKRVQIYEYFIALLKQEKRKKK
eukprot:496453_1